MGSWPPRGRRGWATRRLAHRGLNQEVTLLPGEGLSGEEGQEGRSVSGKSLLEEIRKKRNKLSASTSLNKLPSAYFLLTACSLALLGPPLVITAPLQGLRRNCVPCDNTGSHTSVCSILPHWCFQTITLCPMQTTPPNARSDIHQHLSLFLLLSRGLQNVHGGIWDIIHNLLVLVNSWD